MYKIENPTSWTNMPTILGKGGYANGFRLFVNPTGAIVYQLGGTNATGASLPSNLNSAVISNNVWHHIVITYDGSTQRLFIDNVQSANITPANIHVVNTGHDIGIGYVGNAGVPGVFNGKVDEVKIYNRALSTSEVTQHYYSNLKKYSNNVWQFISTPTTISAGTHTYSCFATDSTGTATTGTRTLYVN